MCCRSCCMARRTRSWAIAATGSQADRAMANEGGIALYTAHRTTRGHELTFQQELEEKVIASLRAIVEFPFRVVKRQWGHTMVRYRGLAENTAQLHT